MRVKAMMQFTNFERLSIKQHPELSEGWVQDCIADNIEAHRDVLQRLIAETYRSTMGD